MTVPPRPFLASPKIDDIAIQDQYLWLDALEIFQDGFRLAFVGSKVDIRNNDNLHISLRCYEGQPTFSLRFH
jgi:hypothetical protein